MQLCPLVSCPGECAMLKWAVTLSGSYSEACGARYGVMEHEAASWEMSGYDC